MNFFETHILEIKSVQKDNRSLTLFFFHYLIFIIQKI